MNRSQFFAALCCASLTAGAAAAGPIAFDSNWREQGLLRLRSNDYQLNGSQLGIISDGTVSLLWRPVGAANRDATAASWSWRVDQSVPATDLRRKGGDDRNIAIYFVYTDADFAASLGPNDARKLLRDSRTRALVYVWGGQAGRGTMQQSPYLGGMRTIIQRPAGTGAHNESVNLANDFSRAFGSDRKVLVGIGVTADSDDTNSSIRAAIGNLSLR